MPPASPGASLHSMASSPHSAPDTPRTASPFPSDEEAACAVSPSQCDAEPMPAHSRMTTQAVDPGSAAAPASAAARAPKGKEKAARGPLRLLDLPVDVLKDIIHQLPHTNDLTSLSLCHSALHRLTIPCIYSRFDIVWPDESTHTEPRSGVDALTYGLATLVMGDDCFPHQSRLRAQNAPQTLPKPSTSVLYPVPVRRFGNYYGRFTKKFSLGNGPSAWVEEYMINKEGGKMLGTLVALAVARMINLETFVWDMPTGVLRDVWLALSSLTHRSDGDECRLDKLWIRWHNNSIDTPLPPPAPPLLLNNVNVPPPPNAMHQSGMIPTQTPMVVPQSYPPAILTALDRVEHPTFSVIPALKSLSVLDIDELPYLDEMSVLIARSVKKLKELRVGIAAHAEQREWVTVWEGDRLQQIDQSTINANTSSVGEKRLGGVLGILVGRIHDIRQSKGSLPGLFNRATTPYPLEFASTKLGTTTMMSVTAGSPAQERMVEQDLDVAETMTSPSAIFQTNEPSSEDQSLDLAQDLNPQASPHVTAYRSPQSPTLGKAKQEMHSAQLSYSDDVPNSKLKLEVLELERVPLSVSVLRRAFDWSMLATLTLLNCSNHEQLWKVLRRTYTPRPTYTGSPSAPKNYKASYTLKSDYQLNLKSIHTNTVSPSLIAFLKESLAPNSLEILFLQEGRSYTSTVTVDAIFRGPMRRHRSSLRKLMIDSGEKGPDGHTTTSSKWRRWMLNREILTFITSGRMTSLRELAVSIDYKDWHHFLQRLPYIPHIRSLYIPFIADHAHGSNIDPRELAYQILDIVHLRPEIELCYMGLSNKCFEILENRPSNYDLRQDSINTEGNGSGYTAHETMLSDDESDATEDDDDDNDDIDDGAGTSGVGDETESEVSEGDEGSDDESLHQDSQRGPKLRVREILFYEERVEAFRRRHGVLRP